LELQIQFCETETETEKETLVIWWEDKEE
jgi:hypothetical protein